MRWGLLCFLQIIYPMVVKHHGINSLFSWFYIHYGSEGASRNVEHLRVSLLGNCFSCTSSSGRAAQMFHTPEGKWLLLGGKISVWETELSLRCTQTAGFWCNMCVCEIKSTGLNLVVVLTLVVGKLPKEKKKYYASFPLGNSLFSFNSKNLILLSKHSILGCSGKV